MRQIEAYTAAGYTPATSNASKLANKPDIKLRVAEIREERRIEYEAMNPRQTSSDARASDDLILKTVLLEHTLVVVGEIASCFVKIKDDAAVHTNGRMCGEIARENAIIGLERIADLIAMRKDERILEADWIPEDELRKDVEEAFGLAPRTDENPMKADIEI